MKKMKMIKRGMALILAVTLAAGSTMVVCAEEIIDGPDTVVDTVRRDEAYYRDADGDKLVTDKTEADDLLANETPVDQETVKNTTVTGETHIIIQKPDETDSSKNVDVVGTDADGNVVERIEVDADFTAEKVPVVKKEILDKDGKTVTGYEEVTEPDKNIFYGGFVDGVFVFDPNGQAYVLVDDLNGGSYIDVETRHKVEDISEGRDEEHKKEIFVSDEVADAIINGMT